MPALANGKEVLGYIRCSEMPAASSYPGTSQSPPAGMPLTERLERAFAERAGGGWYRDARARGKLKVSLGPETEVLPAPHGKDVDVQIVVDLRRMLKQAGFAPDGSSAIADQSTRDHGDGQWGEPT